MPNTTSTRVSDFDFEEVSDMIASLRAVDLRGSALDFVTKIGDKVDEFAEDAFMTEAQYEFLKSLYDNHC